MWFCVWGRADMCGDLCVFADSTSRTSLTEIMAPGLHPDEQLSIPQHRSLTCVHPVLYCAQYCVCIISQYCSLKVFHPLQRYLLCVCVTKIASQPSITPHQSELSCMLCNCKCKCCCASVSMPYPKALSDSARLHAGAVCLDPNMYIYIYAYTCNFREGWCFV